MRKVKLLDWSNYTGIPTAVEIGQLKTDGWEGVILGTQFPDITRQQYDVCFANNFPVVTLYVFVYWSSADYAALDAAKKLGAEWNLKVWLDCEWIKTGYPGTGTWAPDSITLVNLISTYKVYLGTSYKGIYTGRWWWPAYTHDVTSFSGDPLWDANYTGIPDFDSFIPYGGWSKPEIIQYSSGGTDGVVADLNEEEIPDPAPSYWLYGNEQAGCQVVGNRQLYWNKGVNVDILGSVDGQHPGEHWHLEGDTWIQILP